jgi:hypothetical protein
MIETIILAATMTVQALFGAPVPTMTTGTNVTTAQTGVIIVNDTLEMN